MVTIPTISQLYDGLKANVESELNITVSIFGKVWIRFWCAVYAAKLKLAYLVLGLIQNNIAPDLCDEETLLRYGKIKLGRYLNPAVAGQYTMQVTGTIGATIPANTVWKSDDSALNPGMLYMLDEAYTLIASPDTITVRALTAGTEGKQEAGDIMTATAPLPMVNQVATVTAEILQPIAAETIDDYRALVVLAYRLEPKGGAGTDYRLWGLDAGGVKQIYPYAKTGESGAVIIYVEAKLVDSVDGKGTPTNLVIQDVEADINFDPDTSIPSFDRGRKPLQVGLYVEPITVKEVAITINAYQGLDSGKQTNITDQLTSFLAGVRPFVGSVDAVTEKNDIIDANRFINSILTAVPGSTFGSVTFTINGVSVSTYTFTLGNIPHLQSVAFT